MGEKAQFQIVVKINDPATFYFYSELGREKQTHLPQTPLPYYNSEYTWLIS